MRHITKRSGARFSVLYGIALAVMAMGPVAGCNQDSTEPETCTEAAALTKTQDQNKEVVAQFVEQFKNKGNHDIVDTLFAPDFVGHFPVPGVPPTRDGMKLIGKGIVGGFPDVHVTVEELVADHDVVVERTTARGTQKGDFNGIPATGKQVTWTEIHMYRLENGKIAELWSQVDLLGLISQLGAFTCK